MAISNVNQLPSAKLSLILEPTGPLNEADVKLIDYYIDGFKMMVKAALEKANLAKKEETAEPSE